MTQQKAKTSDFNGFGQLIETVWCPICGSKLAIEKKDQKNVLMCPAHGEMKLFVDDSIAAASMRSAPKMLRGDA